MKQKNYKWLLELGTLPRTISEGIKNLGVKEGEGRLNEPRIMLWRDTLKTAGLKDLAYSEDRIPWCGLFAAYIAFVRKFNINEVVDAPLWARNWVKYGNSVERPSLGDVVVFVRLGGGHVAFYVGEDDTHYHVLGGNQSDSVCFTRIAKSRAIAFRRPSYTDMPDSVKPYKLNANGSLVGSGNNSPAEKISENEA